MKKFIAMLICLLILICLLMPIVGCGVSVYVEDGLPYPMEGVEWLNTETTSYADGNIFWIVWLSAAAIVSVGVIVAVVYVGDWDAPSVFLMIVFCIVLVLCIIGIVLNAIDLANDEPEKEYQVTITNGVDYNEFTEHYEEIGRKGEIRIIKQRQ